MNTVRLHLPHEHLKPWMPNLPDLRGAVQSALKTAFEPFAVRMTGSRKTGPMLTGIELEVDCDDENAVMFKLAWPWGF